MTTQPNITAVAFLIADPARAAILSALLDGRARPAGELAHAAGVTAQTASSHLGKLLAGGLLAVETEGRHRYYRLAGSHVALALETLASIAPVQSVRRRPLTRDAQKLRFARCCYDHLAGRVGIALTHGLVEEGFLVAAEKKRFELTPDGAKWFDRMGMNTASIRPTRHGLARQCLDWTEREHHLAGPLGVHLTNFLFAKGCIRRAPSSRAVDVTPKGWKVLKEHFGIHEQALL
ncbi:helix-turn-helix transcriptional regulator [Rhizobium sp. YK2]|uniref:ArsR/SmtB family transcription factor n=2 Tax=unclassified Rhizobium TaxID=2613769 RepID=UPI00084BD680|nr:helix-turn-helix transcriptional regulator [Rhizobium sp. YK2]OEC94678.1 transcriptional regulator [Rhizobium sp. YK2]